MVGLLGFELLSMFGCAIAYHANLYRTCHFCQRHVIFVDLNVDLNFKIMGFWINFSKKIRVINVVLKISDFFDKLDMSEMSQKSRQGQLAQRSVWAGEPLNFWPVLTSAVYLSMTHFC